jgi:hypothetical protein
MSWLAGIGVSVRWSAAPDAEKSSVKQTQEAGWDASWPPAAATFGLT